MFAFSVIVTVLAFGIMVMLHETGHFFMAKKFGVTVQEFSIGMGPLLFKWGKGETQYSLRAIPLGGFVRLEGEDESDNPKAFSNISPIKRIGVLIAGAAMNIVLGFICFLIINSVNGAVYTTEIGYVAPSSAAFEAGLIKGDKIVKLNKTKVDTYSDIKLFMTDCPDELTITYRRDGEKHSVTLSPTLDDAGNYKIGFSPKVHELDFIGTVEYSYYDTKYVVKAVFYSLKMLFTGRAKVTDMSGPVGIVSVVDEAATESKEYGGIVMLLTLLSLFAMISVNLGVFNLLPFPGLDGGSIIFALIELVTRKKPKAEVLGYINFIGLVLILGLGLFVMWSDIMKLIN